MDLDELTKRLEIFCHAKYEDNGATVEDVHKMPGHAGFSYGFSVRMDEGVESWFLRLPPPHAKWEGTADVLRQVEVLKALDKTDVPHCRVKWSGKDLKWFGCPYFIVPKLKGDVIRMGRGEWGESLSKEQRYDLARQAMSALAGIHRVNWQRDTPYLGRPLSCSDDVKRWDWFLQRAADPERLEHASEVRQKLLDNQPSDITVGIFHGDFQLANLFCSLEGRLLAVIDWELVGIGATLNDLGWFVTFSDPAMWSLEWGGQTRFLSPDVLIDLYTEAWGQPLHNLNWYRALAAYKFALITGFNLNLHRRGKRHDPLWETIKFSMNTLIDQALQLL
ncbi:MAG: phosphotransferase family protein [Desulfatiglans sp.]|jgi:aminoglycoside phosphotransferase (APT) family kinase protein|nr:phosphotransferase family protein [Desulfatiglans sp.]